MRSSDERERELGEEVVRKKLESDLRKYSVYEAMDHAVFNIYRAKSERDEVARHRKYYKIVKVVLVASIASILPGFLYGYLLLSFLVMVVSSAVISFTGLMAIERSRLERIFKKEVGASNLWWRFRVLAFYPIICIVGLLGVFEVIGVDTSSWPIWTVVMLVGYALTGKSLEFHRNSFVLYSVKECYPAVEWAHKEYTMWKVDGDTAHLRDLEQQFSKMKWLLGSSYNLVHEPKSFYFVKFLAFNIIWLGWKIAAVLGGGAVA